MRIKGQEGSEASTKKTQVRKETEVHLDEKVNGAADHGLFIASFGTKFLVQNPFAYSNGRCLGRIYVRRNVRRVEAVVVERENLEVFAANDQTILVRFEKEEGESGKVSPKELTLSRRRQVGSTTVGDLQPPIADDIADGVSTVTPTKQSSCRRCNLLDKLYDMPPPIWSNLIHVSHS